jgi:hypothetical protein
MDNRKQVQDTLKREGAVEERQRIMKCIRRHMAEFSSRNVEVDQRVAAALSEIAQEVETSTFGVF